MAIFWTADTHFGHKSVIKFGRRPYASAEEMNEALIAEWNSVVSDTDVVYHLGDFALAPPRVAREILIRLNGRKILIEGGHDYAALRNKDLFEGIYPWDSIQIKGEKGEIQQIFMAHHCHKVWPISHYGCWHLFGHSHGGLNAYSAEEGKLLDVGVDSRHQLFGDYRPFSVEEIREIMKTRPDNFNRLH